MHLYIRLSIQSPQKLLIGDAFSDLEVLDLNHNFLLEIPKEVTKLSKLLNLDVSRNLVTNISPGLFIDLCFLYTLNVTGNFLKSIGDYSFQGLYTLPHLDLSEQKLSKIENKGFMNLIELHTLDLSNNELKELKSDWLSPLKVLYFLDISDNDFLHIDPLLYSILPEITILHTSRSELCCVDNQALLCVVDSIETTPVCDRMIPSTSVLAISIFLCIIIIITNVIVIFVRLITSKMSANSLTIVSLAISDTVYGVYLGIVITTDLFYNKMFQFNQIAMEKEFPLFCCWFSFPTICSSLSQLCHYDSYGPI